MNSPLLHGRRIVIIGGTTGIGLAGARACQAAGARLVVVGLANDELKAAQNALGDTPVLAGDAADPAVAVRAVERAVEQFGGLDGLYHVAGGSGRRAGDGPLDQITDAGWQFTLGLNLNSVFYSNRAAVQQFLKQGGGGCVLNLGSVLAASPSPRHFATHAYAAAKSALVGLCRSCAAYYAPHDIRFNLITPGLVETPMARRAAQDEQIMRFVAAKQPLDGGRIGQPSDLDAAAVYFLSDASCFVTGQVLAIDGGWSVSEGADHA